MTTENLQQKAKSSLRTPLLGVRHVSSQVIISLDEAAWRSL